MKTTMGNALKALRAQVEVGLATQSDRSLVPDSQSNIVRPVRIGELLNQAEAARDELRHTGYGR